MCARRVSVRVVRELDCPEKIVPSLADQPVVGFDTIESLGVGIGHDQLRSSYVLHVVTVGYTTVTVGYTTVTPLST